MKLTKKNLYFKIIGEIYDNLPSYFFTGVDVPKDDFYNYLKALAGQIEEQDPDINYVRYKSLKIADKEMIREQFTAIKYKLREFQTDPKEFFKYFLTEYKDFFEWLKH